MTPSTRVTGRDPLSFLPGVAEKLGWYVYALRDPRTDAIFYVGKGKGERVYQHARHARKVPGEAVSHLKLETIREIHSKGLEVGVEIVRHSIDNEDLAYEVESAVIDAVTLSGIRLANSVRGHDRDRGWQPLEEIVVRYAAEPVVIPPEHRVVLIRYTRFYGEVQTPEELYERTRKSWKMAPNRRKPDYAFSVFDGIVRAVYRIDLWEPAELAKRWAFHGEIDVEMDARYVWKDVSSYLTVGAQNPIKYVNC